MCIREIVTPFAVAMETRRTPATLVSIVKFHTLDSIKTWVSLHTLMCVGMCVCVYMCTCVYKQSHLNVHLCYNQICDHSNFTLLVNTKRKLDSHLQLVVKTSHSYAGHVDPGSTLNT